MSIYLLLIDLATRAEGDKVQEAKIKTVVNKNYIVIDFSCKFIVSHFLEW